ncbi:MAG: hypothetical protein JNK15_01465 [Planctomycetes bacterium]|nr:hypothetical protein [Planctomycetota bacterium]
MSLTPRVEVVAPVVSTEEAKAASTDPLPAAADSNREALDLELLEAMAAAEDAAEDDRLEEFVAYTPDVIERSRYGSLRDAATAIGVELPRQPVGTRAMWTELLDVVKTYERELKRAQTKRGKRLFDYAVKKQQRERIGEPGTFQKVPRESLTGPDSMVHVSGPDGVYLVRVSPGEDAEFDGHVARLRELQQAQTDAATHVLRSHGALR